MNKTLNVVNIIGASLVLLVIALFASSSNYRVALSQQVTPQSVCFAHATSCDFRELPRLNLTSN